MTRSRPPATDSPAADTPLVPRLLYLMPLNLDHWEHIRKGLTDAEELALSRAINAAWLIIAQHEPPATLPDDDGAIMRIVGSKVGAVGIVRRHFLPDPAHPGRIVCSWLLEQYEVALRNYTARAKGGRRAAKTRQAPPDEQRELPWTPAQSAQLEAQAAVDKAVENRECGVNPGRCPPGAPSENAEGVRVSNARDTLPAAQTDDRALSRLTGDSCADDAHAPPGPDPARSAYAEHTLSVRSAHAERTQPEPEGVNPPATQGFTPDSGRPRDSALDAALEEQAAIAWAREEPDAFRASCRRLGLRTAPTPSAGLPYRAAAMAAYRTASAPSPSVPVS